MASECLQCKQMMPEIKAEIKSLNNLLSESISKAPGSRAENEPLFAPYQPIIMSLSDETEAYAIKINDFENHLAGLKKQLVDLNRVKQDREQSRLPYDHYNAKLSLLKGQQKLLYNPQQYNRNKDKLALHEGNFKNLTTSLRLLCREIS